MHIIAASIWFSITLIAIPAFGASTHYLDTVNGYTTVIKNNPVTKIPTTAFTCLAAPIG